MGAVKDASGGSEGLACGDEERGKREGGNDERREGGEKGEIWTDKTSIEENWARVVELVQTAFRDRDLAEEATWQALVLTHKGKGDYWGIGLVEVMKDVKRRFKITATTFHITSTRPMPQ